MEENDFDITENIPPTCDTCGKFLKPTSIHLGFGKCIRCLSFAREGKLPKRKRYNFVSPEVAFDREQEDKER